MDMCRPTLQGCACCGSFMSGLTERGRMLKGSSIVTLQHGSKGERAHEGQRKGSTGETAHEGRQGTGAQLLEHNRQLLFSHRHLAHSTEPPPDRWQERGAMRVRSPLLQTEAWIQGLQHGSRQQTAGSPDLLN